MWQTFAALLEILLRITWEILSLRVSFIFTSLDMCAGISLNWPFKIPPSLLKDLAILSQPLSAEVHLPLHLSLFARFKPTLAKFLLCRVQGICPFDLPSVGVQLFSIIPRFSFSCPAGSFSYSLCPLKFSLVSLTLIQCVTRLLGIQSSLLSDFFEAPFTKIKVRRQPFYPNPPWEMELTE